MAYSGVSAGDPFRFNEWVNTGPPFGVGYSNISGKTLRSSTITPAATKVIITGGQSNMATACGTGTYSTVSANAHQLNIYDGGVYAGADPVLGCMNGNSGPSSISMRLADSVISRGKATNCVVIPIAIGGTKYDQWVPTASQTLYGRITAAILRSRVHSWEPDAIFWAQGESDASAATSAASITASITAIVNALRAAPISWSGPFYVGFYTMNNGVINGGLGAGNTAGVRKGIADSVSVPLNIVAGYDADTNLTVAGGFRLGDQTHCSSTGLATGATGWTTLAFP